MCGYQARTEFELIKHFDHYHTNQFPCQECNGIFVRKSQLERHRELNHYKTFHTNVNRRSNHDQHGANRAERSANRKSLVRCYDCGNEFPNKGEMLYHKNTEHLSQNHAPASLILTRNRFGAFAGQGNAMWE